MMTVLPVTSGSPVADAAGIVGIVGIVVLILMVIDAFKPIFK
jgi:hypothetical protein